MKHVITLLIAMLIAPTASAGDPTKRLSEAERGHYHALQVWMDAKQQREYLHLKTEDERNAWLKDHGLWDRFYQYDQLTRQRMIEGEVRVGWTEAQVAMAWGHPTDRTRTILPDAERASTLIYRFEVSPDGKVHVWKPKSKYTHSATALFRIEVLLADGKVRELTRKEGW